MDEQRLSAWDLAFLLALLGLAAFTLHAWPRLPEHLPAHWEEGWRPHGWLPKRSAAWFMFGVPAFAWFFIQLIGGFAVSEDAWRARIQVGAMAPLRGMLCAGLAALMSLTLSIPLYGPGVFGPTVAAFLACLAVGVAFMARRVQRNLPEEHRSHYKGGLVYYNPDDPRLWVEKLIGIGWTLNFARPLAWLVMILIVALPVGVAVVALRFR